MAPHQVGVIGPMSRDSVRDQAWDTWPGQFSYNIITIIVTNRQQTSHNRLCNDFLLKFKFKTSGSIENVFEEILKTFNYLQ